MAPERRETWAGNEVRDELELMVKWNPSALMYEVKTKKSSDAKHGLEKEALNTWQR